MDNIYKNEAKSVWQTIYEMLKTMHDLLNEQNLMLREINEKLTVNTEVAKNIVDKDAEIRKKYVDLISNYDMTPMEVMQALEVWQTCMGYQD